MTALLSRIHTEFVPIVSVQLAAVPGTKVMLCTLPSRSCAISRDTAERLLARLERMGLVREATGTRRFRLWAAAI